MFSLFTPIQLEEKYYRKKIRMYENTFTFLNTALFEIRLPLQTNIVELAFKSCVRFCLSLVVWSLFFLSPELKNPPLIVIWWCRDTHKRTLFSAKESFTLSETQYDWRKIEPVTMKANFIHFWWVESEFIVKNQFHNWTSELGCIWHFLRKIWLFLALFKQFSSGSTTCCSSVFQKNWLLPVMK